MTHRPQKQQRNVSISNALDMLLFFYILSIFQNYLHFSSAFQVANNQKKSYCSLILFTFWLFILLVVTQAKAFCFNIQIHVKSCNKLFFVWKIKKNKKTKKNIWFATRFRSLILQLAFCTAVVVVADYRCCAGWCVYFFPFGINFSLFFPFLGRIRFSLSHVRLLNSPLILWLTDRAFLVESMLLIVKRFIEIYWICLRIYNFLLLLHYHHKCLKAECF